MIHRNDRIAAHVDSSPPYPFEIFAFAGDELVGIGAQCDDNARTYDLDLSGKIGEAAVAFALGGLLEAERFAFDRMGKIDLFGVQHQNFFDHVPQHRARASRIVFPRFVFGSRNVSIDKHDTCPVISETAHALTAGFAQIAQETALDGSFEGRKRIRQGICGSLEIGDERIDVTVSERFEAIEIFEQCKILIGVHGVDTFRFWKSIKERGLKGAKRSAP